MIDKELINLVKSHLNRIEEEGSIDVNMDLYEMGLDSLGTINLLLDIEEHYEVMIPDEYLTDDALSTISSLWSLIEKAKNVV